MTSGEVATVRCSRCEYALPQDIYNTEAMASCPGCASAIQLFAFPAILKPLEAGTTGDLVMIEGEASCFYHPEKKAVVTCNYCGRFLCSLCDVEFAGQHLCPPCIESGKKKKKLKNLENHRVLYDDVALALAVLPLLICYFVVVTAPISLYIAIRYWNAPGSIIPRSKARYIVAIFIASIEIIAVAIGGYFLISKGFDL